MDAIIKQTAESYPLTGEDINKLTNNKCNIWAYSQITDKSLDEILGNNRSAIILLEYTGKSVGHWVALFEHKNGIIEYYNSLGFPIDYQQDKQILTQKLYNYRVIQNKQQLQSKSSDINTCGRYAVLRLNYRNISLQVFNKLLTQNKAYDPDFWVSVATCNFLTF